MSAHRPSSGATGSWVQAPVRAVEVCCHPSLIVRNPIGLMRARISQLNGCAYRLGIRDMESHRSRATEQSTCLSNVRVVSRLWSSRERTVQDWTGARSVITEILEPNPTSIETHRRFFG